MIVQTKILCLILLVVKIDIKVELIISFLFFMLLLSQVIVLSIPLLIMSFICIQVYFHV